MLFRRRQAQAATETPTTPTPSQPPTATVVIGKYRINCSHCDEELDGLVIDRYHCRRVIRYGLELPGCGAKFTARTIAPNAPKPTQTFYDYLPVINWLEYKQQTR